jgi:hypothetical protein
VTDPRWERIEWFQQQRYGDLTADEQTEYRDLILELAAEAKAAPGFRPRETCCDYRYFCPTRNEERCYAHGDFEVCCEREDLHECLRDPFGGDGLMLGDGFMCMRCGNYEPVGVRHDPALPGFPRKTGPPRHGSWLDDPPALP